MGFVLHVKFRIYQVFSGVHVKFKNVVQRYHVNGSPGGLGCYLCTTP